MDFLTNEKTANSVVGIWENEICIVTIVVYRVSGIIKQKQKRKRKRKEQVSTIIIVNEKLPGRE